MSDYVLGCDNGLDGSFVLLHKSGEIHNWWVMPTYDKTSGRGISLGGLKEIRKSIPKPSLVSVVIERPTFSKSARAAMSMYESFGTVLGFFAGAGFKVSSITPMEWQKPILSAKAGDTKPAALRLAQELWPNETWLATKLSRKPHDGGVDGALIAEYGRRNNL